MIVSALGVGSIAGGLVALHIKPRRPLLASTVGLGFFALPPTLLALRVPAVDVAAGALFAGLAGGMAGPIWETTLQRHIPRRALSRVSAYDWLVSLALVPVGQVLVGPISAGIGIDATLWGAAAIFAVGAIAVVSVRDVRELGSGEVPPEVEQQMADREREG